MGKPNKTNKLTMKKPIKLEVEMIPSTNFYNNVRSAVSQAQWDVLRKECYEKADNKCEICGDIGKNQGFRHSVECHEIWSFDFTKNIQSLIGLIALCPFCHMAKHIGRTFAIGKQALIFKHIEKINQWEHKEVVEYLGEVFMEHRIRSQQIWTLNLDYLKDKGVTKINLAKASKAKPKHNYHYNKTKKKKNIKSTPKK